MNLCTSNRLRSLHDKSYGSNQIIFGSSILNFLFPKAIFFNLAQLQFVFSSILSRNDATNYYFFRPHVHLYTLKLANTLRHFRISCILLLIHSITSLHN